MKGKHNQVANELVNNMGRWVGDLTRLNSSIERDNETEIDRLVSKLGVHTTEFQNADNDEQQNTAIDKLLGVEKDLVRKISSENNHSQSD